MLLFRYNLLLREVPICNNQKQVTLMSKYMIQCRKSYDVENQIGMVYALALRTQKDSHLSITVVKQPYGAIAYLMAHSLSTSFLGINETF